MKKRLYPFPALISGLFSAQILASIHVYLSNTSLFHTLYALKDAGYLTIPNRQIMQNLNDFSPAFCGGVFFSLSLGAGLSVFTLITVQLWDCLFKRSRMIFILISALLTCLIAGVNISGFLPIATSYFIVIPAVVFITALKWIPVRTGKNDLLKEIIRIAPVILLTLLWTTQMDRNMFQDIRDNLLLSNSAGLMINDFYYKYTLYPAQVIKSQEQKTLKTCCLKNIRDKRLADLLETKLTEFDYLNLPENSAVDMEIDKAGNTLIFKKRRAALKVKLRDFLSNPGGVLKKFSFKCDRYRFFRKFTFVSFLVGFPVILYIICYGIFFFILSLFWGPGSSEALSSVLCFLIGVGLFIPVYQGRKEGVKNLNDLAVTNNLEVILESRRWQERVAGLKIIEQKRMDPAAFRAYRGLLQSPYIQERCRLVTTILNSGRPETYEDLINFLDDPSPNVSCMAFYVLGLRGDKRAVYEILKRIKTSDHWYKQWYAYRALKALGWRQTGSE